MIHRGRYRPRGEAVVPTEWEGRDPLPGACLASRTRLARIWREAGIHVAKGERTLPVEHVLVYSVPTDHYELTVWEEASSPSGISRASWLVSPRPQVLRLAVIDGSTSLTGAMERAGVEPAAWAAAIVRATLLSAQSLESALEAANDYLHQPLLRSQAQSMAAVLAVEVADEGSLSFVLGGNCEAWLHRAGRWTSLFGPQEEGTVRIHHRLWLQEHFDASAAEISEQEGLHFGEPRRWYSAPPGRFPETKLGRLTIEDGRWDELVLASEGARLSEGRVSHLSDWLAELRDWERDAQKAYAAERRHRDVAVIRVNRARLSFDHRTLLD